MKYIIASLLTSLSLTLFAQAIEWEKDKHDFGKIQELGGVVEVEFEFKSTGDKPLVLRKVQTSCGCTVADYPKEPIKKGKKGTVKISFDPKSRPGSFSKTISVFANTKPDFFLLHIQGVVEPRPKTIEDLFSYEDGNLRFRAYSVVFDSLYDDTFGVRQLEIYNQGEETINIKEIRKPSYVWHEKLPKKIVAKRKIKLKMYYSGIARSKTKGGYGIVYDDFYLVTDDKVNPEKKLYVVAQMLPSVQRGTKGPKPKIVIKKAEHDFGTIKEGDVVTHRFSFSNLGEAPLEIFDLNTSCGCTASKPQMKEVKPGQESYIEVTFDSSRKPGMQDKFVEVYTNDPENSPIKLRIKAQVK